MLGLSSLGACYVITDRSIAWASHGQVSAHERLKLTGGVLTWKNNGWALTRRGAITREITA